MHASVSSSWRGPALVAALLEIALAGGAAAQSQSFRDRTWQAGLAVSHTPPPQTDSTGNVMLGGGAVGDYDADGWQDLFILGGGGVADRLFMNRGGGTVVTRTEGASVQHSHTGEASPGAAGTFQDLAQPWGVAYAHIGAGATAGDYDGDGRLDLYVTSHGTAQGLSTGAHRLYHNEGDHFSERASQAGVATTSPVYADGFGAAFGDYDLDGDLDLFVAGWQSAVTSPAFGNRLFRNAGDGTFSDVTSQAGLFLALVHGFTPQFVDMNGDRFPELLLAADFDTSRYLVNQGDGTFVDETFSSGTGQDSNGMGQCVADFDGDGRLDWYVTSIEGPTGSGNMLYLAQGEDTYLQVAQPAGVLLGGWGWGTLAVDVDHDGWEDIVETNGWPTPPWDFEQSYLFMNQGKAVFVEQALARGLDHQLDGKGVVRLDADNDGDQDLVFFANNQPVRYFRNDVTGPDAHWLHVTLDHGGSGRVAPHGYGARVVAITAGHSRQRVISGGGSYLSCNELSAHFGLGAAAVVDTLRIEWPDGRLFELHDVPADQRLTFTYTAPPVAASAR